MIAASSTRCIDPPALRGAALRSAFPHRKKPCSRCGDSRELREYTVAPRTADGLHTVCNRCRNAQERARNGTRRRQRTRARLHRLAAPSTPWERLEALARTIERSQGGLVRFERELQELAEHRGGAKLLAQLQAARFNCLAAAEHGRVEQQRLKMEAEREAAEMATDVDMLDAAVDVIRRQPRRRRRELIRIVERLGPESFKFEAGGGI